MKENIYQDHHFVLLYEPILIHGLFVVMDPVLIPRVCTIWIQRQYLSIYLSIYLINRIACAIFFHWLISPAWIINAFEVAKFSTKIYDVYTHIFSINLGFFRTDIYISGDGFCVYCMRFFSFVVLNIFFDFL